MAESILFEAVSTPPRSFSPRGFRVLALLLGLGASVPAAIFLWLGAWPILGFLGLEVALAPCLILLHDRWSRRAVEVVMLTEDGLTVTCTDHRGRRQQVTLEPYWTRVAHREGRGEAGSLALVQRDRRVEIGRYLAEAEKRELAEAMEAALARYRSPVFDNPQLRDC